MFACCCHRNVRANVLIEPDDFYPYLSGVKINPISQGLSPRVLLKRKKRSISDCNASSQQTLTTSTSSDVYDPEPMTMVLPQLYLGSYEDAVNEHQLKEKKITHILSLIGKKSPVHFVQIERIPMHDHGKSNLKGVLKKISTFMWLGQKDRKVVLVHCLSGQNRSATVVVALLMMYERMTLYNAYRLVKSLRPMVQINKRYAKQLLDLEKEVFGKNTLPSDWMERDVDNGIDEVTYKYEKLNSLKHRLKHDSEEL